MNITLGLLTGPMRSGTSVLGKIIGSFDGVEFFYEPMTFITLLLNKECRFLLEDYIYYDLLMASLAGRNLNLNSHDDSSVYNYKSKKVIEERLSRSWSTDMIHESNQDVFCLVKYPSYINQFAEYESNRFKVKKIFIFREPVGTILSLMKKKWFNESVLTLGLRGEFKQLEGKHVPLWLADTEVDLFWNLDEMGRCLFYYTKTLKEYTHNFDVVVSYDMLCNEPKRTVNGLLKKLSLKRGDLTNKLIEELRPEQIKSLKISKKNEHLFEEAMSSYLRISDDYLK